MSPFHEIVQIVSDNSRRINITCESFDEKISYSILVSNGHHGRGATSHQKQ